MRRAALILSFLKDIEAIERIVLTKGRYEPPLDRFVPTALRDATNVLPQRVALHAVSEHTHYALSPKNGTLVERNKAVDFSLSLEVKLRGLAAWVPLCGQTKAFDPTPCVDAARLQSEHGTWRAGRYTFPNALSTEATLAILRSKVFSVRARIGAHAFDIGQVAVELAPPTTMTFVAEPSFAGPNLDVKVSDPIEGIFLFEVDAAARQHFAVVRGEHVGTFTVVTKGGQGLQGRAGADGSDGWSGSDGSSSGCDGGDGEDGDDGEDGEDGGPGGRGGHGGEIRITYACSTDVCKYFPTAKLFHTIGGRGGEGGPGGRGGAGGSGGRGGSGGTCSDGSTGLDGSDGRSGSSGWSGKPGPPGQPGQKGTIEVSFQ